MITVKQFLGGALFAIALAYSFISRFARAQSGHLDVLQLPEPEPEPEPNEDHLFSFIIYAGDSLTSIKADPIAVVFDADYWLGIQTMDMDAWGCLLSILEFESA